MKNQTMRHLRRGAVLVLKLLFGVRLVFLVTGAVAAFASAPSTNRLVLPPEAENAPGNSDGLFFFFQPVVQQVYGATEFANAPSDQILLSGVSFRLDENAGGSLSLTFPATTIRLGLHQGLLSDLVPPRYADMTTAETVFSRKNYSIMAPEDGSFNVFFPFSKPYQYDRRSGHLVLELRLEGGPSGLTRSFDSVVVGPDRGLYIFTEGTGGESRIRAQGRIYSSEFLYMAVPEPRTIVLLVVGICALFLNWRKRWA